MILSHQHGFVFVAIPKTGTHSVRRALRVHLGPDDQEQVGLFAQSALPYPELAAMKHGHLSLLQLRPHLGEEKFDAYFKFAFVRNPFDRFVSYCSFMTRHGGEFLRDPQGVMRSVLANPPLQHILFVPQYRFVTDAAGELLASAIFRVESMQADFDACCARIGLPTQTLEKANSSRRGEYRDYYDQALIDSVAELYARDIELFGYTFQGD